MAEVKQQTKEIFEQEPIVTATTSEAPPNETSHLEDEEYEAPIELTETLTEAIASHQKNGSSDDPIIPDFLSYILHQVRSPLNAISGYGQLMDQEVHGELNPKYKEYVHSIEIACTQATESLIILHYDY